MSTTPTIPPIAGAWLLRRTDAVDPEDQRAERYTREMAAAEAFRRDATAAVLRHDWPAFFTAAAECARSLNAAGRIVDAG